MSEEIDDDPLDWPSAPWVRMGENCMVCHHCGETQNLPLPMDFPIFVAMAKAYAKEHAQCKPPADGEPKRE